MATGTGKTFSVLQIIWRFRNILADQTVTNDFKPFDLVMTKVCNRDMDPSYAIYIALYQAEGEVDITAWFGGQRSITAWEEVIGLGSYRRVLTVLTCPSLVDEVYMDEDEDSDEALKKS